MMNASPALIILIERFEGFKARPYLCPAGVPTIGYGSTRYPDGQAVTLSDPPIDDNKAIQMMYAALREYEAAVNRYVTVQLTQGQYDALVDFAYNCGAKNLKGSSLLQLVNKGKFLAASDEFGKWVHGGGKILPGLVRRREAERKLFLS